MLFLDTHAHLYAEEFNSDIDFVMNSAIDEGIGYFLLPNIDKDSIPLMQKLVQSYPDNCFAMMGLHPCSVDGNFELQLKIIERQLFSEKYIAVGEIGMDLFWDKSFLNEQKKAFQKQIDWAVELNIPICIHCRDAFDEIYSILNDNKSHLRQKKLRGVFHCFSGTFEQAQKVIELGFYLGIGGVVTFKNSGIDKVMEKIDLSKIILETDSPYLAPVPYRGKRNESKYILNIAYKIAEIKNESIERIASITSANAIELFQLKL
jgi:TatD DNase family protein